MQYIYTTKYYSVIQKNELMTFASTWMDLEIIILGKSDREKANIICYHLHVESEKKKDTKELIYKTETVSQILKTNLWLTKRKSGWRGRNLEF